MRPPLPKSADRRLVLGVIVLGLLLAAAGRKITQLQEALNARPLVEDFQVDDRDETFRRGPVKITTKTIIAPDGTKTIEKTEEKSAEERHVAIKAESGHKEAPVVEAAGARPRKRYVGVGVDPLAYARMPRLRAGVNVWGALDVGLAYDSRFSPHNGALQVELTYRF